MNKLILVIVEGATDANYLAPICKLSKEKKIKFKITKGDILTRLDTNHLNIEEKINIIVDEFLKLNKLHYSDLVSVVHICDLDGTYIDDDKIVTDHSLTKTKYFRDKIVNAERKNIINRNQRKSMCLEKLINKKDIKISRTIIPYKIYYFSTNIDDYFFGEQNLEENKKIQFSYIIRSKYENEPQLYKKYICENNVAPWSYAETWNFAKSGDNSLQRLTNFNKFLEKHI